MAPTLWSGVLDARGQMALVQLAAIGASLVIMAIGETRTATDVWLWPLILLGFGLLRVLTAGASLATSTMLLEPVGIVLLLAGTGGADSPFLPLALAGIWWAARSDRAVTMRIFRIRRENERIRLQRSAVVAVGADRPIMLVYGAALAAAYMLLVGASSLAAGRGAECIEDAVILAVVWTLAEVSVRAQRRRVGGRQQRHLGDPRTGVREPAIRAALTQALRALDLSPSEALAVEELGLTAQEAELLACLIVGLTNQEIADAVQVSEAAVRYRLTHLYRRLGVRGRKQAAERGRELGLALAPRVRSA